MNNKSITQLRLDEILHEKVKIIANLELRSMNAQLEYFIKRGVEQYEKDNQEILISQDET